MIKKHHMIIAIAGLISVAGCSNKASEPSSAESSSQVVGETSNPKPTLETHVTGYKSFQFGMNVIDVAKLPECIDRYKSDFTAEYDESDLIKKSFIESIPQFDEEKRYAAQTEIDHYDAVQAGTAPGVPQDLSKNYRYQQLKQTIEELKSPEHYKKQKDEWAQREAEVQRMNQQVESFGTEAIDKFILAGQCNIEFMGTKTTLRPLFRDYKLVGVRIHVGEFNSEKYEALAKSLSEKYSLAQSISEEQRSAFNKLQSKYVVTAYANGQIGLYANNVEAAYVNPSIGIRATVDDAIPVNTRNIVLKYVDENEAATVIKAATKGTAKAEDL